MECPTCSVVMDPLNDAALKKEIDTCERLKIKVAEKAVLRAKYEGLDKNERLTDPNSEYFEKLEKFAVDKIRYFACKTCAEPYYGGLKECADGLEPVQEEDPYAAIEKEQQEEEEAQKALEELLGEEKAEEEEVKAAKQKQEEEFVQIAPASKTPPAEKADERQAEVQEMSAVKEVAKIEFIIEEPPVRKIDFETQVSNLQKKTSTIETQTDIAPQMVN